MYFSHVPGELVAHIVDEIAEPYRPYSTQDLLACSQVCHTLSSHCRKHLFQDLSINSPERCITLRTILARDPDVIPHIKRLSGSCHGPSFTAANQAIFTILSLCTQIESLSLVLGKNFMQSPILAGWACLHWPRLRTLCIIPEINVPCSFVELLLARCTILDHLRLCAGAMVCYDARSEASEKRRTPVRWLELHGSPRLHTNAVLRLVENIIGMETLKVVLGRGEDALATGELIKAIGSGLLGLDIAICGKQEADTLRAMTHVNLSSCTRLQSFELWWLTDEPCEDLGWASHMLASIGSRVLERFAVYFTPSSSWRLESIDWPGWGLALAHERQPMLRSFSIWFGGNPDTQAAADGWFLGIRELLPDLDKRGLLSSV